MKAYGLASVIGLFAFHLHAAPALGVVSATPMTAVIGTSTQVTVTASITDTLLIPGSVNLLQLNPDGSVTILGALHDDGLNGDAFGGDKLFTLVIDMNMASAGEVELQVSAAFKGVLQRVKSPAMSLFFQAADAPQQAIKTIAQLLAAGNMSSAFNYVITPKSALNTLNQAALNALAAMLDNAVLVSSQNDLRLFQAPAPDGTMAAFTMIPGPGGQWLINSW